MKKRLLLFLIGLLFCAQTALAADFETTFATCEKDFSHEGKLIYHYTCRYPVIQGDGPVAESLNHFFERAVSEMTDLVLPMYAADPDMAGDGNRVLKQEYEITCNNGKLFSTLMRQEMGDVGKEQVSLFSQVFALEGPYQGETLTLRGMLGEIGDSSDQIAQLVLNDIWQKIEQEMKEEGSAWQKDLTLDTLSKDFFPQEQFYADQEGRAVFYLEPGLFRTDTQSPTYVYSAEDVLRLLNSK